METSTHILFGMVTLIAIINSIGMLRVINRGLKIDFAGLKHFDRAMFLMVSSMLVLAIGQSMGVMDFFSGLVVYAQLIGTLLFVFGVMKLNKIPAGKNGGSLTVEWGELQKEIEATSLKHIHNKRLNIEQHLKTKNLLLVEVDGLGIAPVLQKLVTDIPEEKKVFPIIGVITPYDLKRMWGGLGNKGGFWMTTSDVKDEWVNQKFVVGKPSESFQLTNYIKTVSEKYEGGVVYIGDFFDEMHASLNDAQRQQLLSRMKTLLQQNKSLLILIIDKGIHESKEIEMMERYADGKLEMSQSKTVLHDLQTNETIDL